MALTRSIFSFRIAYQSEEEVAALQEKQSVDPNTLELTILPDGQPSFKTIFVPAFSVDDAISKAEEYVKNTKYRDIENNKTL